MKPYEMIDLSIDESNSNSYLDSANTFESKTILKNMTITIAIMVLATLLSFFFRSIGFHESNIIMAYILGVLFIAKQTDGYIYGIVSSIIGVLTFNFFFTEPYFTFVTYRPDYPVTFIIMLVVAIITSTLTAKAKHETRQSSLREQRTLVLYQINKELIKTRNINQIVEVSAKNIAMLFGRSVIMITSNSNDELSEPYLLASTQDDSADILKSYDELNKLKRSFEQGQIVGDKVNNQEDCIAYYTPIRGQSSIIGAVGVSCFDGHPLLDEQRKLLEAVTSQIALALERERIWEKQQKSKMDVERERLRGNLLRAISHDLRTPLTGILGATATILENDEVLDKTVKIELLQNIYEDTNWLIHTIENILSITRIEDGSVKINKNMEAVEEIVAEAVSRLSKLAEDHVIKTNLPEELIMIPMDGMLIEQVLMNLIDNAIKYTEPGSTIELIVKKEKDVIIFEVSDNGKGIPIQDIPYVFDRFYTTALLGDKGRRGTGLGLAICKAIVIAHGGEIKVYNNVVGGASFVFTIPYKE